MGEVGGSGAPTRGAMEGTAPTEIGACRAVCAGICESSSESVCGDMTEASHRNSSSALMARIDRFTIAVLSSSMGAILCFSDLLGSEALCIVFEKKIKGQERGEERMRLTLGDDEAGVAVAE